MNKLNPEPTARDEAIMEFIYAYRRQHRYSPSIREICDAVDIPRRNISIVKYNLDRLAKLGRVQFDFKVARSIVPIRATQAKEEVAQ
jgi:SOS-response transcriptional repressor LexA